VLPRDEESAKARVLGLARYQPIATPDRGFAAWGRRPVRRGAGPTASRWAR